jgi:ACT domain-containing protein
MMIKRYIIKQNNLTIAEVDNVLDIYKQIGCSRQHYYKTLQFVIFNVQFNFKNDTYSIIDRLNVK